MFSASPACVESGSGVCPGGGLIRCLLQYAALYRLLEVEIARGLKLRLSDLRCLQELALDQLVPIKRLTRNLGVSGSRLSRILDRLEQKHLLRREIDAQDRRSILVHLTARGEKLRNSLLARLNQAHSPGISALTPQDARIAEEVLEAVSSQLACRIGGQMTGGSSHNEVKTTP